MSAKMIFSLKYPPDEDELREIFSVCGRPVRTVDKEKVEQRVMLCRIHKH